ncbi:MAG: Gfo/Idh/MocA family oxidoreductase [Abditibacteriales bacterium]|nr:Gfo/Idh/MocA family oxidoreductase [Abditibacteriales bacterium]MDW8368043.1 Gfo/Idh/MocA family oxidoreductase [Abditibacteriales bacterium]
MEPIGVGIIGSQFVAEIHAEAFKQVRGAEVVAVASHVRAFAEKHHIPKWFTDYRKLLELDEVQVVSLCLPNYLHCQATLDAAKAGKHVICEKPLCMNLQEADAMIQGCKEAGVKLMYAEELCFTPKYVRAKQLVDEGALGKVYLVKQSEKHFGPHAEWFWDIERSGGGVLLDMGCHGIEFARWILGRPKATSVLAQCGTYVHKDKTKGDDNAIIIIEFENDAVALIEESWARQGGMDDRAEIYGSQGVTYADLLHGSSLETYSEVGYGYAVEKAPTTRGWTFTMFEEIWNYGFPQEMQHFIDCVRHDTPPAVTGEDGKVVLEIIFAAYESAGTGRKVALPFATEAKKPIDLWLSR